MKGWGGRGIEPKGENVETRKCVDDGNTHSMGPQGGFLLKELHESRPERSLAAASADIWRQTEGIDCYGG